jgi:pimeloyl-ACP methyl ester carboxylesterase
MTTVFIHGVPDTARVWSRLAPLFPQGEVVALSLPGFGCALPQGFQATKEDYANWLIAALEAVPGPRDVIAHDWGSILLLRVVSLRPDLIRSWVGGGAPYSADYTWHPTARLWQTPGAGEKAMERLTAGLTEEMLKRAGVPQSDAQAAACDVDARMKDCILSLYRSGRDVFREWAPDLSGIELQGLMPPGLVLWGERDAYAGPAYGDRIGDVTGAKVVRIDCGHWWQVERPAETADAIWRFWHGAGL